MNIKEPISCFSLSEIREEGMHILDRSSSLGDSLTTKKSLEEPIDFTTQFIAILIARFGHSLLILFHQKYHVQRSRKYHKFLKVSHLV